METDWLGPALAFVAGMVVAFICYQKGFIASAWERLTGVTPDRSRPARARNMTQLAIANVVTAIGLAAGISFASEATGDDSGGWRCWSASRHGWRSLPARFCSTTPSS